MARNVRRRRKQRFYWAEIGFLILGLIGLRPSIVSEFLSMGRALESRPTWNANSFYDTAQPWSQTWSQPRSLPAAQQSQAFAYPTITPGPLSDSPDRQTQYQANYPASSNAWEPARSSNVAWPDAQLHHYVHTGGITPNSTSPIYGTPMTAVAPHVASPYLGPAYTASQTGAPAAANGLRYQTPGTTNPTYNHPGFTGTGGSAPPPYTGRY